MLNAVINDEMHEFTEKPGQLLSKYATEVIYDRFEFLSQYIQDKDLLNVGAGVGVGHELMAQCSKILVHGEYSNENLDLVARDAKINRYFVALNAHQLPFVDKSFDVVSAMAMIYYLEIKLFVTEAQRVLRQNGLLLFCTSNKNVSGFIPALNTTRYYSIPELDLILKDCGFTAKYYGAFPSKISKGIVSWLFDKVKPQIKMICKSNSVTEAYWERLKLKRYGPQAKLEKNISQLCANYGGRVELSSSVINTEFRVIYVVATLKNK